MPVDQCIKGIYGSGLEAEARLFHVQVQERCGWVGGGPPDLLWVSGLSLFDEGLGSFVFMSFACVRLWLEVLEGLEEMRRMAFNCMQRAHVT